MSLNKNLVCDLPKQTPGTAKVLPERDGRASIAAGWKTSQLTGPRTMEGENSNRSLALPVSLRNLAASRLAESIPFRPSAS